MKVGEMVWYWQDIAQPQPMAGIVTMVFGNPTERVCLCAFRPDGMTIPALNVRYVKSGEEPKGYPYCMPIA